MRKVTFAISLIVLGLAAGGCPSGPCYVDPADAPAAVQSVVDRAVVPLIRSGQSIGCVVGVVKDGHRYVFGYGRTKQLAGSCPHSDTLFEIGSITKTFTCALLASMVKEGLVSLDDPAQLYVPEGITLPTYEGREITLADLATHTSGLPEMPDDAEDPGPSNLNPLEDYDVDHLYSFVSSYTLTRQPGTVFEYSTLGTALLANVLASKAGMSYEGLLRERILGPLGLDDTGTTLSEEQRKRMVQGYTTLFDVGGTPVLRWPMPPIEFGAFEGGGALRSSAENMLTYLEATMGETQTPLHEALTLATTPHFTLDAAQSIGLGWVLYQPSDNGAPLIWHDGQTYSCSSFAGFLKDSGIAVVVLNNTDNLVDAVAISILEGLSGRQILQMPAS